MTTTQTTFALLLTSLLIVFSALVLFERPEPLAAASPFANSIGNATTSTTVSVTTSQRLLATTTNTVGDGNSRTRVYATICNPNANPVYLYLGHDEPASLTNATYVLAAAAGYNVCYEITDRNQYSGSITASSTNQTATVVTVSEYTQ